jgi:hypothetical protein
MHRFPAQPHHFRTSPTEVKHDALQPPSRPIGVENGGAGRARGGNSNNGGWVAAPELERVTRLGLQKLEQVLRLPTDRGDGNLLRAQVTAAGAAIHAQLRADETRLRAKVQSDTLERLLKAIEKEKARQRGEAVRELPRLDVSHGEDADR